jgi:hypothetical protein
MGKTEYRGLLDRIEPAFATSRAKLPKQPASAA